MVLLGLILVGLRSFSQFRNRQQEKEFFLAWRVLEKSWLLDFYPTLTLPDALGRELIFPVSPQSIGGIRGVSNWTKIFTVIASEGKQSPGL
jgi:hypothetical protein